VVETVDRYGLKKWNLHKHWKEVKAFFDETCGGESPSEVARGYQARFEKYRGKLFTFLDHDGVPWNNTNPKPSVIHSPPGRISQKKLENPAGFWNNVGKNTSSLFQNKGAFE
jgi:hypothetical protein